MKRLIASLAALGLFALLSVFVACSGGDDAKIPDAGADTGPADTGADCGPTNVATLHCREGAPGKACGSLDQAPVKTDPKAYCSMFMCGMGMTPVSMCACNAESQKVDAGADCPGGPVDSGATD